MIKISDSVVDFLIESYKIAWRNTEKQSFVDGFSAGYHYSKLGQCTVKIQLARTRLAAIDTVACQRGYYTPHELDERRRLLLDIQNQAQESNKHLNAYYLDQKKLWNNYEQYDFVNRKEF